MSYQSLLPTGLAFQPSHPRPLRPDAAEALAEDLRRRLAGEVRFDPGSRALYATDGSNYRQVPIGVVIPKTIEDVIATVGVCREHQAPVLPRGGGTSLAGQCCNIAVVMDFSKYLNRILELNPTEQYAVVEPGCVLDDLRNAAEQHHLTFGPDPSTHSHNTLGGMLGNNSCGVHSVMAGRTADNTQALEILTYDGLRLWVGPTPEDELESLIREGGRRSEIYAGLKAIRDRYAELIRQRYPNIPRRVSGYNLDELLPEKGFNVARALVGSEGTCVTILQARLRLVPSPPKRTLLVLGYPDVYQAGDHVPDILQSRPIGLEGLDDLLIDYMKKINLHPEDRELLPPGGGWLLVEFGGEAKEEADGKARRLMEALKQSQQPPSMKLFDNPHEERMLWEVREAGLGATAHVPGMQVTHEGWEDAAVPPARVGPYLRAFRKLLDKYGYHCALYGHFGDGCIHVRIDFDLSTEQGLRHWRAFVIEAADLVLGYGGSLSGEHGDGQSRAELLPKMFGEELMQAMREFKSLWDPAWKMNPRKVVEPYRIGENLRTGPGYRAPKFASEFSYPEDHHSFATATERCVGVGNCRRHAEQGVMCPSFMVTREEKHSTRGRARLLFEMVHGMTNEADPLQDGWKSDEVREALDLCLACKGCKGDCPVRVDMATYKAEFMHRYYQGRLRPRTAYSMGLIYWWSRAASLMPGPANFMLQTPGLSGLVKWAGGIAKERRMPKYAAQTFRGWFTQRLERRREGPEVLLWPDTFNNYFHPEVLQAAVRVLEAAGYQVSIPGRPLCCARPLYAEGMLKAARSLLLQLMDRLGDELRREIPVVGLEPACVASFRDELINLFPADERANYLFRNTFMLDEFLERNGYQPPRLERKALVHAHCNHHSIMGFKHEIALLDKLGLDCENPPAGCCGMAGSFGFEAAKYPVSIAIGERVLLPAVRNAAADILIISDGFSCREQIEQGTGRQALHLAQVLDMALAHPD